MQKVNTAGLRLLSLPSSACEVGPSPVSENLDLRRVLPFPKLIKVPTIPNLFVQTKEFILNIYFTSGSLEFWYILGRRSLGDRPPVKPMGTGSLAVFHGRQHYTHVVKTCCWGNQAHHVSRHWRGLLEACVCFPPDFSSCTFPFAGFACVSFHDTKSQP